MQIFLRESYLRRNIRKSSFAGVNMEPFVTNKYLQIWFLKLKLYDLRLHRQIRFVKQIRVYLFVTEWRHVHTAKYLCANIYARIRFA